MITWIGINWLTIKIIIFKIGKYNINGGINMKNKITVALLTAAMSLSLVACSNKENVSKNEKLEDTVVVYTTHKEEMLEAISDEFTKETGINVEFINLKG